MTSAVDPCEPTSACARTGGILFAIASCGAKIFLLGFALCSAALGQGFTRYGCPARTDFLQAVANRDIERARMELASLEGDNRTGQLADALHLTLEALHPTKCYLVGASPDLLRFLISVGADVNRSRWREGRTFLMQAVFYGQLDMAKKAVEAGADVNARNYYESPLLLAVQQGDEAFIRFLLFRGADPNLRVGDEGSTISNALSAAARKPGKGNRILKALIAGGAVHPKSDELQPLEELAKYYDGKGEDVDETILLLQSLGGEIEGRSNAGMNSPLCLAVKSIRNESYVIEALIRRGSDPNRFALFALAERHDYANIKLKRKDVLEILFRHGARIEKTKKPYTEDLHGYVLKMARPSPGGFNEAYIKEIDEISSKYSQ
jgi:ankyrin repeat protein